MRSVILARRFLACLTLATAALVAIPSSANAQIDREPMTFADVAAIDEVVAGESVPGEAHVFW